MIRNIPLTPGKSVGKKDAGWQKAAPKEIRRHIDQSRLGQSVLGAAPQVTCLYLVTECQRHIAAGNRSKLTRCGQQVDFASGRSSPRRLPEPARGRWVEDISEADSLERGLQTSTS
jgi:hypothetical protein